MRRRDAHKQLARTSLIFVLVPSLMLVNGVVCEEIIFMWRIWLPVAFQNEVDRQQSGTQATVISNYASLNEATRSPEVTDPPRQAQVSVYASLALKTRSWEVPRESLTIMKIIGKGAFGQVAKATATRLLSIVLAHFLA